MAFTPRTFQSITSDLVAWILGSPEAVAAAPDMDLVVGSIERSHLEVVAVQVEEIEVRTAQAVEVAILESCYRAFGFERLPARAAFGSVVFTAIVPPTSIVTIPSGTRVLGASGQVYVTSANAQLAVGATTTAAVPITAMAMGTAGNAPANTVTRMVAAITGLDLVTNSGPILGGKELEADESRADRFASFVRTLQRGTREALEYAALSVSAIQDARVIEPYLLDPRPPGVPYAGLVWVFCDDGAGLTAPTKDLVKRYINGYVDNTGARIPGWKAAGVRVDVLAAKIVNVRVRGSVKLVPGGGARWDAIKSTLTGTAIRFFGAVRIGDVVSYQALSADLNKADDDIAEVNLFLWNAKDAAPAYSATPLAADFNPIDAQADPFSLGSRCVLDQTTGFPEWVLE